MTAIDDLREIAPPPREPTGRTVDWEATETRLGLVLPADYRALATEWGAGSFGDFVSINEPGHPNPNLELVHEAEGWRWAMEELAADEPLPYPARMDVGGLLAWGASDNGDPCYWHLRSEDPATWTVVIQEGRGPEWHVYDGGLVDFLVAFLMGREQVSVFPDGAPSQGPDFVRA